MGDQPATDHRHVGPGAGNGSEAHDDGRANEATRRAPATDPSCRPVSELPVTVVWDTVPDGLVLVDSAGVIVDVNAGAEALFGYPRAELVGQSVEILVPDRFREAHQRDRSAFGDSPVRRAMGAGLRLHGQHRDGSVFPVNIGLAPVVVDGEQVVIASVRDITDWLRTEEELADANRRRVMAEDHERIARDLHDTVIQELFAVGMALQAVHAEASDRVKERIARAVDSLDETIRQIRGTIFGLRSTPVAVSGLRAELEAVLASFRPSLGFDPHVEVVGPIEGLSPAVAVHVVPTVREGLSNVARHARASHAMLRIEVGERSVRVEIVDDGVGLPDEPERSSGLTNLARRAQELGGEMTISRRSGGGTHLQWTVPLAAM